MNFYHSPVRPLLVRVRKDVVDLDTMKDHEGSLLMDQEAPVSLLCSLLGILHRSGVPAAVLQAHLHYRIQDTSGGLLVELGCWRFGRLSRRPEGPALHFPNDDMSFSWQRDSMFVCTTDVFYGGGKDAEVMTKAKAWVDKNDEEGVGENGIPSKEDCRLLWGSHGTDLPANTHVLL